MDTLAFALNGRRVGIITRDDGCQSLRYDADYLDTSLAEPNATPLSLSLPVAAKEHHSRIVEAFLRGLLPDHDGVRRRWEKAYGLKEGDTFGLIRAVGLDCAGGALFAPEDKLETALACKGKVIQLTEEQIGLHLRLLGQDVTTWHEDDDEQWSLSGAQAKFTLIKTSQGWGRAQGSTPSTHIIKPGISVIPAQALTEHVSMRALALLGEQVAQSEYYEFDGEPAIIVTRFDRLVDREGKVRRVHSEDLVQSLGLDPTQKYEDKGGPGVEGISAFLSEVADESSTERFIRAVIANYLLGAPDAHARNYSLLLKQDTATLAPLYDVASGFVIASEIEPIRNRQSSMSIGGEITFGEVTGKEWRTFAQEAQQDDDKVRGYVEQLASCMPDAIRDAISELPRDVKGYDLLMDRLLPRIAALAQRTLTTLHVMNP